MTDDIKKLAILYFEGTITPDEEHNLFAFIIAGAENVILWREWEREWKETHIPSVEVLDSLDALKTKMQRRAAAGHSRRLWLRFTAAAAVLIAAVTFSAHFVMRTETPAQLFSVQAPLGTNSRISLPDGTQVWLNAGSTLSYTSNFNRTSRDIDLSGEAYFDVAENAALPFHVVARGCRFTVLGTKFNISAYDSEPEVLAALMQGSLRFESSFDKATMTPGDLITYNCESKLARCEQVDVEQFRSWIDGIIRYDAITLPALMRRLSREYNVKIELCTQAFDNKTFRFSLTGEQTVESIMSALGDILPVSIRHQGDRYYIDKE